MARPCGMELWKSFCYTATQKPISPMPGVITQTIQIFQGRAIMQEIKELRANAEIEAEA